MLLTIFVIQQIYRFIHENNPSAQNFMLGIDIKWYFDDLYGRFIAINLNFTTRPLYGQ